MKEIFERNAIRRPETDRLLNHSLTVKAVRLRGEAGPAATDAGMCRA